MSKRKKYTLKEPQIDNRLIDERGPTAERMRGADLEIGDTGVITVRQSPIERAVRRGILNEQQGRAAEKLYQHWYRAGMAGTMGSADPLKIFATTQDHTKLCASEAAETHWNILTRAMRVVRTKMDDAGMGMDAVKLLDLVVCREISFAEAGMKVLKRGGNASIAVAIRLVRGALRVLVLEWGL